jgi:hypothetical protein
MFIATLLEGSALGSSILGVVFALVYLKQNNINEKLKVNIHGASSTAKYFFKHFSSNLFEIINMPISNRVINEITHPGTTGVDSVELFYTPGTPGYSLFETDYGILQESFTEFWNSLGLFDNVSNINSNYTCLHIRRGDKLIYEKSLKVNSINEYASKVEDHKLQESSIVIVTDQYDTFLDFKTLYPSWNITTTSLPENKGFNITNINKDTNDNIKKEVNRMLEDFNYILKSNYFIGTRSSTVSYIGKLLKKNINSILLD